MDEDERKMINGIFERIDREVSWLKNAYESGDVREEYNDLVMRHFEGLKQISGLLFKLLLDLNPEEAERHKETIEKLREVINAVIPHAERFGEIRDRLPNKYDMYLATVEAPPGVM